MSSKTALNQASCESVEITTDLSAFCAIRTTDVPVVVDELQTVYFRIRSINMAEMRQGLALDEADRDAALIALCLVNADNRRKYTLTAEDLDEIKRTDARIYVPLLSAINEFCLGTAGSVEETEKN